MTDKITEEVRIDKENCNSDRKLKKDPLRRAEALKANLLRRKQQQNQNNGV